jgi:zinc transport system substrate-binding protein
MKQGYCVNGIIPAILAVVMAGCNPSVNRQSLKPVILVSILPQKTFIEKIGGDDFLVSVLIPHGANPTTYCLLPAQMEEISSAGVWFRMGYVGFELSWGDRIRETNPGMKIIDLSEKLELMKEEIPGNGRNDTGTDPHTWLSPANVRTMAARILEELVILNPAKKDEYTLKFMEFEREIDYTDNEIRKTLENSKGKTIITYHPSLTYFARDYGLIQLSIEREGKEPTPAHLAMLASEARDSGIGVIYIQSEFDRELAGVFAGEINGRIIQIWPLNPDWSRNLTDIASTIASN